ncbi:TetR/AcrR family transcriptional regulator [Actinosynnema sp. ALI-1.44]|uniref:TetR/AcrR family transcriptional regulator n=1 Tax=Actinosynnema sp. ALI-1.44 TaxID=1933779 RepID=UPI001178BE87|nr:TetR/AcrR family transcriptional regulator [Actinosynnema sp. ALI-1.44]
MKPRRRQARGERRMAQLLDAAEEVFAAGGFSAATTNAIAATAGVSPGTLYQFFPNKESMATALADRYVAALAAAHDPDARVDGVPLDDVIDRMVDPAIGIAGDHRAFEAMFRAHPCRQLRAAVTDNVDRTIAARVPELDPGRRRLVATVVVKIIGAVLPDILAASGRAEAELTAELKRVLRAYLLDVSD